MANKIEEHKEKQQAEIRVRNRVAIARKVTDRVLEVLANSPNLENGISGMEIAEVLRPITDEELDYTNISARKLDFESPEDLINEVDPLIRRGLAKMREERKTAA